MINLGTSTMQDFALGDNLVERIDLGDTTIFDPYTTLTGTLPLTFNSRAAVALKNYRIYGTSEGAGDNSYNLWTIAPIEVEWASGQRSSDIVSAFNALPIGTYTLSFKEKLLSRNDTTDGSRYGIIVASSDTSGSVIARKTWGNADVGDIKTLKYTFTITSQNIGSFTAGYLYGCGSDQMGVTGSAYLYDFVLNEGSEALPYGYKIPILNTSRERTNNIYDSSATDTSKGYVVNSYLNSDGTIGVSSSWRISEFIEVIGGVEYDIKWVNTTSTSPSYVFYNKDKQYISGYAYGSASSALASAPLNAKYLRISVYSGYLTSTEILAPSASNYDLFIGDTKLGEEEYLDYAEQKVYKLKEVHKDTVTINGIEWDILGYDHDTVYKSDNTLAQHSVTIQTHDCISELQFDAREALFAFPEGLAAGTYHFTVSQQPWYAGDVGKTMQFTLTNAIPADGVIVLGNAYNAMMIGSTISVYASCSATTATETATISEGNDGTDLGSVGNAISGNTNSIQRALLGSNNYNESAIRQYLNSDGTAGTYWTPQNKWDRPPSWNASTAGLLYRMDPEFVSVIGKVKKCTAKNTVSDGGGYIDTEEKVFLLSKTEVYAGTNNSVDEGGPYRYFSEFSDLSSAGTGADSNRTKCRNSVAKYWWLRSPYTGGAGGPFGVYPSGEVYSSAASNSTGVAPACCIVLDDINANPYLQSLFLKPADPPAPLPAIQAYQGKNTLSSTETLGEVTVKGRISEISP